MMARWTRYRTLAAVWFAVVGIWVVVLLRHHDGSASRRGSVKQHQLSADAKPITISWVGDMTLGSQYGLPPGGARPSFAGVRHRLRRADLTIGNLEGTFSVGGGSKCGAESTNCFAFQAPPGNASALRWAGFDVVNLANNHAFDYGAGGEAQTVAALDKIGVAHAGQPLQFTTVDRRHLRVVVVGFAPYPWANDPRDLATVRAMVAGAKLRGDLVVVLAHLGSEGKDQTHVPIGSESLAGEDRGDTRAFAHYAIDAGADLVLGSGPHVLRGLERYHDKLIAYSLGNFVGWHNFATGGVLSRSAILTVKISPHGDLLDGRLTSIALDNAGTPRQDPTNLSGRLVSHLGKADFGAAGIRIGRSGRLKL